jgi:hypothetical protein
MIRSLFIKPYAAHTARQVAKKSKTQVQDQEKIFQSIIRNAVNTKFAKDHAFSNIKQHKDYIKQVPIRDYEGLKSYVELIQQGNDNVLWKGKPKYFAKTSGTTSGVKYIPISKESMPYHMSCARNALLNYVSIAGQEKIFDGKMIFLSGSPEMDLVAGVATGRLSGIVNHEIPAWVKPNQVPDYATNCIEPWEKKLEKIVEITAKQDMRLISGIPPWVQMYFEQLLDYTGKSCVKDIFPKFNMFVYGGVNYEPYRNKLDELIGEKIHTLETYPASEGFIAFQDRVENDGLLLQADAGIYYEFVPLSEIFVESPTRLELADVEIGKDYAVIVTSNAGLWAYNLGDTVRFVSLSPYRLVVSGRIKHFISAFGEHVISKEVETAIIETCKEFRTKIVEFTVAPNVNPEDSSLPYHEWFIEFDQAPESLDHFAESLDKWMCKQNIYYLDLIDGNILVPLKIRLMQRNAFRSYMEGEGKLGGQNKVPRLSNDRKIADKLKPFTL